MAEIKSSSGMRGSYTPTHSPENKRFVVNSVDPNLQQMANNQTQYHSDVVTYETPAPQTTPTIIAPERKSLIEKLLFLGRGEKEIDVFGMKFVLITLTNKESSEIMREVYKLTNANDISIIRTLTLAQAIKSIDGILIDDIELGQKFESPLEKRKAIVETMQLSVINKIMDEYDALQNEVSTVNDEEIKK